jgi:hypothetical protein
MNKQDLSTAIAALGTTQTGLAKMLELGDRTVRRYVAGDAPIPRVVELAVIYLLQMYRAR